MDTRLLFVFMLQCDRPRAALGGEKSRHSHSWEFAAESEVSTDVLCGWSPIIYKDIRHEN